MNAAACHPLVRGALAFVLAFALAAAATALAIEVLGLASVLRHDMGLSVLAPTTGPNDFPSVALTNLRLAAGPLIAALVIERFPPARVPLDLLLGGLLAVNAAVIGAALAAYGAPLARILALHGTLELAGFALAGGAYVAARRHRPGRFTLVAAACASATLLVLAALAETHGR